jgi:hypothetical protein
MTGRLGNQTKVAEGAGKKSKLLGIAVTSK